MAKATKKENPLRELSREERKTLLEDKLVKLFEEHGFKYAIELVYAPQGIVPRLLFVDSWEQEEESKAKEGDGKGKQKASDK